MTMSEKFSLKWNDFHSNVSKSFGILRKEDYLQDVTLVGDDNHQLPAHRLVLSACSEYFKEIFKRNKHPSTLVCLEGLLESDLNHVLDYIYNGEVNIYQEDLDRFLGVAQRLKLEGLLERDNNEDVIPSSKADAEEQQYHVDAKAEDVIGNQETILVKQQNSRIRRPQSVASLSLNGQDQNEIDTILEENLEILEDGHVRCRICGKDSTGNLKTPKRVLKLNMKSHIEMHIEGLSYSCQPCGKEFRCKNSYMKHKSQKH